MATESKKVISLKLDAQLVKQVDLHAVEHDQFRSEAVTELLRKGLSTTTTAPRSGYDLQ